MPAPQQADMRISCILYDGDVFQTEADEYVEIANLGSGPQDLAGWKLQDIDDGTPIFLFPSHILVAGGVIRVYTNEIHAEWGGFSFGRGSAAWTNNVSQADTAGLFDESGALVSQMSYPPGC